MSEAGKITIEERHDGFWLSCDDCGLEEKSDPARGWTEGPIMVHSCLRVLMERIEKLERKAEWHYT